MDTLGRYEIIEEIGRGAMGVVYRGNDPKINRTVALKCLRADLLEGGTDAKRRFQQEMQALGRLIHTNIVTIFDAGEDTPSGRAYIVMEFAEGVSLSQVLKEGRVLSIDQVVQIGIQICRGLNFAHERGVIHRDIKPGNILLSEDLQDLKLADFGIARLDNADLTRTNQLTGTPQYMSPEQCRGETLDGRSDLFATGAVLYELLTQKKAFHGASITALMLQILDHSPTPPSSLSHKIPESLSRVVMKALEKDAINRFESGEKMAEALLAVTKKTRNISLTETGNKIRTLPSIDSDETRILSSTDSNVTRVLPSKSVSEVKRDQSKEKQGASWARYALWGSLLFILGMGLFVGIRKPSFMSEPKSAPHITLPEQKDFLSDQAIENQETSLSNKETLASPAVILAGQVLFATTPSGADIVINGHLKGISPISLELPAGTHELVVAKKGYHTLEATIDVPAGKETPINLKLLEEEKR